MSPRRRVYSITTELLNKSREAALSAAQIFNNPLIHFKSETFIVLMIIAWTYLLHCYYRTNGIEHRYFRQKGKRRIFDKTQRGAYKYWELERCLNVPECPLDRDTANNLRFLIGLRHEIEHQMTTGLDQYLSARYQACAINFNYHVKSLFGDKYGIDQFLTISLQFLQLSYDQTSQIPIEDHIPEHLRTYIAEFDGALTETEFNSERYSYRLLFTKKTANRVNQADKVIEFLDPTSELAQQIDKEYWVKKEVEKPKHLPKQICQKMQADGYSRFKIHQHTTLWKSMDAKNPAKGYGVQLINGWYWYDSWVEFVRQHCQENADKYR